MKKIALVLLTLGSSQAYAAPCAYVPLCSTSSTVELGSRQLVFDTYSVSFPAADGTSGQFLRTDGAGVLSWSTAVEDAINNGEAFIAPSENAVFDALATKEKVWSTSVKTTTYTAVDHDEVFANTTSAGFSLTLPATPTAGMSVRVADYAGTWAANNLTIARNGENIMGEASDLIGDVNNAAFELVYVDSTQGWRIF